MPAYMFPRDRGPAIRDGRQRLTLAAPRDGVSAAAAHAIVGDPVQLDLAPRGDKRRERAAVGRCILRAAVVITPEALVRVVNPRFRERDEYTATAETLARLLRNAENGAAGDLAAARLQLARACGFRSWKALYEWNAHRDRRGRPDADGRVTREVIGWAA